MDIFHINVALLGLLYICILSPAANAAGYTTSPLRGKYQYTISKTQVINATKLILY